MYSSQTPITRAEASLVPAVVFDAVKQLSGSKGCVDVLAGCHLLFLLLANKRFCLCAKHSKQNANAAVQSCDLPTHS